MQCTHHVQISRARMCMCMWCFACLLCCHATLDRVCTASAEGDRGAEDFGGEDRGDKAPGPLRSPPVITSTSPLVSAPTAHTPQRHGMQSTKSDHHLDTKPTSWPRPPPSCLYPDQSPIHRVPSQSTPQPHHSAPSKSHSSFHRSRPPSSPSQPLTLSRAAPRASCPRSTASSRQ